MESLVYIALGSNQGNRVGNLKKAVAYLPPSVVPLRISSIYETPPWGYEDQPPFLNQVLEARTALIPEELLVYLKVVEQRIGRRPSFRYGPRLIDLDILFYDDQIVETPGLTIPHPNLHERAFVLVPLGELAPDFHHPVIKKTIHELLAEVDTQGISAFSPGNPTHIETAFRSISMPILIKSGTLITASETFKADIMIEDEKIVSIGQDLPENGAQVIDAAGKLILPGGVDVHTHFNLPMMGTVTSDDHYSGHKAAAFGGTTTTIDFVPQDLGSLEADIDAWHQRADPLAAVDFGFHMNITRWDDKVAEEIGHLPKWGITSLKVFTAYNQRLRLQDGDIFQVMRSARKHGLLTMLHAENGDVIELLTQEALAAGHITPEWHALTRPSWGAVEAVLRASALAAQAKAPLYIVHMNVAGEVDQLSYARQQGLHVMGETCPQYLFFTVDHLRRPDGAKWVCSPPMRSVQDNLRLWEGLANGTIQTIATDHCSFIYNGTQPIVYEGKPFSMPGKELGKEDFTKIPNGLPGVGDRLPILWSYGVRSGRFSPNQFVALNCTNPAKIFGLYPRKGTLLPGSDADIVIWDPERRITYGLDYANHRTDYNLYENWELVGYPEKVFLRGHLIVDNDQWLGSPGMGRYLHRSTCAIL
jgi:dihydropyrimidinase